MSNRKLIAKFTAVLVAGVFSCMPTRGQSQTSTTAQPQSANSIDVGKYLSTMRGMIQRYDDLMLSLVGPGGTTAENDEDCKASAGACENLATDLEKVKAPPEVATEQGGLSESLTLADDFFRSGGVTKHGFHGALDITKEMYRISDEYHQAVLSMIHAHGLSDRKDPFISERALQRTQVAVPPMKIQPKGLSTSHSDQPLTGPASPVGGLASVNAVAKPIPNTATSQINGVDGSLGMSGLFNGLGGTDTNGLVDGLGMSSGLNGMVNGVGMSSGMSGMLNDTTNLSPAPQGKY